MSGIDLADLAERKAVAAERKAVAAEFSYLPIHKQHEWVITAILMSQRFQDNKRCYRRKKKWLIEHIKWPSNSTKEELMMFWGLDKEEAENLLVIVREGEKENRSLGNRLGKLIFEGMLEDPDETNYNDEEAEEEETEVVEESDYNIDDDKGRKKIQRDAKLYREKIEEDMRRHNVARKAPNLSNLLSEKVKSGLLVTKEGREVKFECWCLDGVTVELDPICFFESDFILDKLAQGFTFGIPIRIHSNILKMVNRFCVSRWMTSRIVFLHDAVAYLHEFEKDFVLRKPLSILVRLMHAAIILRIKSLMDMTRGEIVDRIKGKSVDDILNIFNMPGFTHKELQKFLIDYPWAYKQ